MAEEVNLDLDKDGHPIREGVYQFRVGESDPWEEIDVYHYSRKGFCCFQYDICPCGGIPLGVGDDDHACHISVQFTGLIFGKRMRGFDESPSAEL